MKVDHQLRHKILERIPPQQFFLCYQCGSCSSSCPIFQENPQKFNPRKILQMAALGLRELIEGDMIWRCTTCYECVEQCPQNINFVDLIVVLRNIATEEGFAPKEVVKEAEAVAKGGFILPETGRIRRIREEAGLPAVGKDDLAKELETLRDRLSGATLIKERAS